jgi:hypothetical protein
MNRISHQPHRAGGEFGIARQAAHEAGNRLVPGSIGLVHGVEHLVQRCLPIRRIQPGLDVVCELDQRAGIVGL